MGNDRKPGKKTEAGEARVCPDNRSSSAERGTLPDYRSLSSEELQRLVATGLSRQSTRKFMPSWLVRLLSTLAAIAVLTILFLLLTRCG